MIFVILYILTSAALLRFTVDWEDESSRVSDAAFSIAVPAFLWMLLASIIMVAATRPRPTGDYVSLPLARVSPSTRGEIQGGGIIFMSLNGENIPTYAVTHEESPGTYSRRFLDQRHTLIVEHDDLEEPHVRYPQYKSPRNFWVTFTSEDIYSHKWDVPRHPTEIHLPTGTLEQIYILD